jgi:anaerobic dimethyl sulfoxide reductase subunit A
MQRIFLKTYTIGFDKFRDYILGKEDGIVKTPEWAEGITGVSKEVIERIALDYASQKPASILVGFAPGRSAAGEEFHRVTATLSAITGNVGVPGGGTACLDLFYRAVPQRAKGEVKNYAELHTEMPLWPNPVAEGQPLHEYSVGGIRQHTRDKISCTRVWDAILRGKAGGYANDIKMLFVQGGDTLNQMPDCNQGVKALKTLDFVWVNDMFLTPTARYADYVLPVASWMERDDIRVPWMFGCYALYANKVIDPLYETKTDLQIFTELAKIMGVKGFNDRTDDEWLRIIAKNLGIPNYERFKEDGIYKEVPDLPVVGCREEIKNISKCPFPTPSGKIEIYSSRIAAFGREHILPSIPKYVETWESYADPLREKYPFQLITIHSRRRVHSQLHNTTWFKSIEPHALWINSEDAEKIGIKDGALIRVFNQRGTIKVQAKVTQRIMPGVVALPEGAWFTPDENGVDIGGCGNVLIRGEHSPGGAFCSNTALVQIMLS